MFNTAVVVLIGLVVGLLTGIAVAPMLAPPTAAPLTGAFVADTTVATANDTPEAEPLQFSEAFLSDVPVVDSAKCEANPYASLRYKYTYICQLFYKTPIEMRKVEGTGSMWPNLKGGGYVIIAATDDLKIGDIVIVNATVYGKEVVHRINETGTDANGTWYTTQGDNNAVEDNRQLRGSDISYKVVGIVY